jgi:UDP-N-acetylmuramate dehydrogenase
MKSYLDKCQKNISLAPYTTLKIGGNAEYFFEPENIDDLATFIKDKPQDIPVTILGEGSNILVRDGGVKGIIIRLNKLSNVEVCDDEILAQAGASSGKVSRAAREAGLKGVEFLCGIPGSVGGALAMNAGAYGYQTADNLISVNVITNAGEIKILSPQEIGFEYRKTGLPNGWIFVSATFKLEQGNKDEIRDRMRKINRDRSTSQPLNKPSSGSWFKNTEDQKAWQITDKAGCRGMQVGNAQVSEKHSNFFVNLGGATAKDMENLSEKVEKQIQEKLGLTMHREVKIIGDAV